LKTSRSRSSVAIDIARETRRGPGQRCTPRSVAQRVHATVARSTIRSGRTSGRSSAFIFLVIGITS
jgi:hypothetical protein